MKKTVSINIGGIIFHIEEDGYDKLKGYLDSVNKYFSTFEDSAEIIADIESRIAEIFLGKLSDGRQTLNTEDVKELIATMGTTRDFEAVIESEEPEERQQKSATTEEEPAAAPKSEGARRLMRNTRHKVFGGVASGIAHYFRIDPLWIRLLFLALFFNALLPGVSGAALLAYIILWIVLPPNNELEEDVKVKKLFRNPDGRVLGGVGSGLASYFGVDTAVVRLLFVLSIFLGGAGIIVYIILWIITPEARSITEKMQMQGEPVTLSNIEDNVKKSLNVKEGEESTLVKVLLFPFRIIALVINGIGKMLGPFLKFLVEIIRVVFGALLAVFGFSLMIGLLVTLGVVFGITTFENMAEFGGISMNLIRDSIGIYPIVSTFVVLFIPALAFSLLGLVVILKRRVAGPYLGWSLFALWVIAMIVASFSIPTTVRDFVAENDIRAEQTFEMTQGTPTLKLTDLGYPNFDLVDLRLRGHADSVYLLVTNANSRGKDRDEAAMNAQAVKYEVIREADDFYFKADLTFPEGSKYRFQNVDATFYIPYGKVFRMDNELKEILVNTLHLNDYRAYQMEGNDWVFDQDGIKCLTCPDRSSPAGISDRESRSSYAGSEEITYPFENFDEVKVSALFDIEIRQGEDYSVVIRGKDELLDEVSLNQVGSVLEVNYKRDNWKRWLNKTDERVGLFITLPELDYLELTGECKGDVIGFTNEKITLEMTGASDIYLNVSPEQLKVKMTGASKVDMNGEAQDLDIELIGASSVDGFNFQAERVNLSALGASEAEIHGNEEINIVAAGASKVRYRGTEAVSASSAGMSSIRRD